MGTSLNGFVERFNRNIMGCKYEVQRQVKEAKAEI